MGLVNFVSGDRGAIRSCRFVALQLLCGYVSYSQEHDLFVSSLVTVNTKHKLGGIGGKWNYMFPNDGIEILNLKSLLGQLDNLIRLGCIPGCVRNQ